MEHAPSVLLRGPGGGGWSLGRSSRGNETNHICKSTFKDEDREKKKKKKESPGSNASNSCKYHITTPISLSVYLGVLGKPTSVKTSPSPSSPKNLYTGTWQPGSKGMWLVAKMECLEPVADKDGRPQPQVKWRQAGIAVACCCEVLLRSHSEVEQRHPFRHPIFEGLQRRIRTFLRSSTHCLARIHHPGLPTCHHTPPCLHHQARMAMALPPTSTRVRSISSVY